VGGVCPRTEGFLAVNDDEWHWALEVNLLSAVRATRAAVPHLIDASPSAIVTICSVNASLPDPGVIDAQRLIIFLKVFGRRALVIDQRSERLEPVAQPRSPAGPGVGRPFPVSGHIA
jgi:NAD(P)-dependent dehydrogenase (short-subunit alcohol dehydrogenase family)